MSVAAIIEIARLKAKLKELKEKNKELSMAFLTVLKNISDILPPEQIENVAEAGNDALSVIREQIAEIEGLLAGY